MKTLLLNVNENKVEVIDIDDDLDAFYRALDCDWIDIVQRRIGGKLFDVMFDDEGLLKDGHKISAINDMGKARFVGNLMFFHNDGHGNLVGLEEDDIKHIQKYIKTMYTYNHPDNHPEGYLMLTQCEY